jgi:hypothetical protein
MKQDRIYRVYIQDTDGSERLGATVTAKSDGHAKQLAQRSGVKNITSVVATTIKPSPVVLVDR